MKKFLFYAVDKRNLERNYSQARDSYLTLSYNQVKLTNNQIT